MLNISLSQNYTLKKVALWLHEQHARAYSYYKVREAGLVNHSSFTAIERDFYLKLRPALQGNSLIIYDIGAAKGKVSSCLAKLPNVASIYAFEPLPQVYEKLVENMRPFPQVYCHNVALGDSNGKSNMYVSNKTDSSSLLPMAKLHQEQIPDLNLDIIDRVDVPIVRLDEYVKQQQLQIPHLIKIDVQGYEQKILEGAKQTVCQAKYCVLEMSFQPLYEGSPLFDDIYSMMRDLEFNLIGFSSPLTGKSGLQLQVDGIFENQKLSK